MGGTKKAQKPEGYDEREAQITQQTEDNQRMMDTMMYHTGRNSRIMWAQGVGMEKVNSEMTEAMTNAQKTIAGYESQERRRLFEAKKGSGQVDATDTAIGKDAYDAAKSTLESGSAAWDEKRKTAMNVGGGGWDGQHGSLEDWLTKKASGRATPTGTTGTTGTTNTLGQSNPFIKSDDGF